MKRSIALFLSFMCVMNFAGYGKREDDEKLPKSSRNPLFELSQVDNDDKDKEIYDTYDKEITDNSGENEQDDSSEKTAIPIGAISAGHGYAAGLKSDGTVTAVGLNYYGQCDVSDRAGIRTTG